MSFHMVDVHLDDGIELHVCQTEKFKSSLISVYIHQELSERHVTRHALLPQVLLRGSRQFPDQRAIQRKLQSLYGAELTSGVSQWGDLHSLYIQLELVDHRYIPGAPDLLAEGVQMLGDILYEPAAEGDRSLKPDYVEQEKVNLRHQIEALINDKAKYANRRCIEEMFDGTPFALYTYGKIDHLADITAENLYAYYQEVARQLPMDLFIVTSRSAEEVAELARKHLVRHEGRQARRPAETPQLPQRGLQEVIEEKPVQQGKLSIGYRTGVFPSEELYNALIVYNGILGGFVHSKLFRNVREKASLAYYAYSRLDGLRGVMLVSSGIDVTNYEKTLEIIQRQVDDMRQGQFEDDDLLFTKRSLANTYRSMADNPAAWIDRSMYGLIVGQPFDLEKRLQEIEKVERDQVVAVAQTVDLDTIYFLTRGSDEQ